LVNPSGCPQGWSRCFALAGSPWGVVVAAYRSRCFCPATLGGATVSAIACGGGATPRWHPWAGACSTATSTPTDPGAGGDRFGGGTGSPAGPIPWLGGSMARDALPFPHGAEMGPSGLAAVARSALPARGGGVRRVGLFVRERAGQRGAGQLGPAQTPPGRRPAAAACVREQAGEQPRPGGAAARGEPVWHGVHVRAGPRHLRRPA